MVPLLTPSGMSSHSPPHGCQWSCVFPVAYTCHWERPCARPVSSLRQTETIVAVIGWKCKSQGFNWKIMYKSCINHVEGQVPHLLVLSGCFKQCQCCGWVEMISIRSSRSRGIPQRQSEKNWKMKAWSSPSLKKSKVSGGSPCGLL